MFDRRARSVAAPALEHAAAHLARTGLGANTLTGVGWLVGVGACVAAGTRVWSWALVAWLANRLLDGLDGALARRRGATDLGGYLDLLADFSVYARLVVAVAVALPATRLAGAVLLASYYLSASAMLAASAMLDRRHIARGDERSIHFLGGIAEGLETVVAFVIILLVPAYSVWVEWVFSAMVLATAVQRVTWARRALVGGRAEPAAPGTQVVR